MARWQPDRCWLIVRPTYTIREEFPNPEDTLTATEQWEVVYV